MTAGGVCTTGQTAERLRHTMPQGFRNMLSTIMIILLVLWVLGMVTSYTMGGLIHVMLIIAIIMVLVRVIQGRSPLVG
jgi:hypothetical protein